MHSLCGFAAGAVVFECGRVEAVGVGPGVVERQCGGLKQAVAYVHGVGDGNQGVERCLVIAGQLAGHILECVGFARQQREAWQVHELVDDEAGLAGKSEFVAFKFHLGADKQAVDVAEDEGIVFVIFLYIH
ncbi:MAG: hypothetical protein K2F77_05320, partial [Muribaculaceae bacterium]|nr:hypothetical protein [Muribaculaceae bacterium]